MWLLPASTDPDSSRFITSPAQIAPWEGSLHVQRIKDTFCHLAVHHPNRLALANAQEASTSAFARDSELGYDGYTSGWL
jgi:hypothetical protein